ncbi:hypothetical protein [Mucilaginibacter auburnensis]|uniref:Uncharacterized protein n=1 Tax=Mucilaginibacter auburnensis TaxID=1457233 RepID=A0A2H9VM24_9SPHI|nr:hypothetical protein [Mucilaginibacter auburnensis]PJJ79353.1 hypothetical protein CLV57_2485 [Mucilaginibacter auburnensis]
MEQGDYWFLHIAVLCLQLLIGLGQAYLIRYWHKEDISSVTKLVESVKLEFSKELAQANSDLDILKDRKGKSYSQAQQALIDFYYNYNTWLQHLLGTIPEYFTIKNYTEIEKYIVENGAKFKEAHVSFSTVSLLVTDDETVKSANECLLKAMEFDGMVINTLGPLEMNLQERDKLNKQIPNTKEDLNNIDSYLKEGDNERRILMNDFHRKKRACYLEAHNAAQIFENRARFFLNK